MCDGAECCQWQMKRDGGSAGNRAPLKGGATIPRSKKRGDYNAAGPPALSFYSLAIGHWNYGALSIADALVKPHSSGTDVFWHS